MTVTSRYRGYKGVLMLHPQLDITRHAQRLEFHRSIIHGMVLCERAIKRKFDFVLEFRIGRGSLERVNGGWGGGESLGGGCGRGGARERVEARVGSFSF